MAQYNINPLALGDDYYELEKFCNVVLPPLRISNIIIELPVIAVHSISSISSISFQVNCPAITSTTNFTVSHVDVGFSIDIPIIESTSSFSITDIMGMDRFIDLPVISSQNTFKISGIGTSFSTLLPSIASQNLFTISSLSHDISLSLPAIKTTNAFDISNVSYGISIPVVKSANSFTVSGIEITFIYDHDICTVDIDNVQSILGFAKDQILKIMNT